MNLDISELTEVCSALKTCISKSKMVNKKNRLQRALKKLERQLCIEESKFSAHRYSSGRLTFRTNNLCLTCGQPKPISTVSTDN